VIYQLNMNAWIRPSTPLPKNALMPKEALDWNRIVRME
jgi:hypothetical protein